jgi:hypothetical protein
MSEPIVLEPGDYWRLMALERDVRLAQYDAGARCAQAAERRRAWMDTLRERHPSLNPDAQYRADDDACTLSEVG